MFFSSVLYEVTTKLRFLVSAIRITEIIIFPSNNIYQETEISKYLTFDIIHCGDHTECNIIISADSLVIIHYNLEALLPAESDPSNPEDPAVRRKI